MPLVRVPKPPTIRYSLSFVISLLLRDFLTALNRYWERDGVRMGCLENNDLENKDLRPRKSYLASEGVSLLFTRKKRNTLILRSSVYPQIIFNSSVLQITTQSALHDTDERRITWIVNLNHTCDKQEHGGN